MDFDPPPLLAPLLLPRALPPQSPLSPLLPQPLRQPLPQHQDQPQDQPQPRQDQHPPQGRRAGLYEQQQPPPQQPPPQTQQRASVLRTLTNVQKLLAATQWMWAGTDADAGLAEALVATGGAGMATRTQPPQVQATPQTSEAGETVVPQAR